MLTDDDVDCLSSLTKLESLHLISPDLSDDALECVARFPHLTRFSLVGGPFVTDDGIDHLASLTSLETLQIAGTSVTGGAIEALRDSLPNTTISYKPIGAFQSSVDN